MEMWKRVMTVLWTLLLGVREIISCQNSMIEPEIIRLDSDEIKVIDSPNWPKNYGPNELCYWRVEVPVGKKIGWKFHQNFELEGSMGCLEDYVRLYDNSRNKNLIKIYCGKTVIPNEGNTTSRYLLVKFRSNSVLSSYSGFRLGVQMDKIPDSVPSPSNPMMSILLGVIITMFVIITVALIVVYVYMKKLFHRRHSNIISTRRVSEDEVARTANNRRDEHSAPDTGDQWNRHYGPPYGGFEPPRYDYPPPPYKPPTPPPSYDEATKKEMEQPV